MYMSDFVCKSYDPGSLLASFIGLIKNDSEAKLLFQLGEVTILLLLLSSLVFALKINMNEDIL